MVGNRDIRSHEDWKKFVTMFRNAFPDIHFTIEDQIAEGDMVATRWTFTGTLKGKLKGIPPTGQHVSVTGVNIYRIVANKIVEFWVNSDDLGMFQQIGVIPPMGQDQDRSVMRNVVMGNPKHPRNLAEESDLTNPIQKEQSICPSRWIEAANC